MYNNNNNNNNFIIIITLFESQIILAEHECCTNWGDCKSNKSNQIKCWFLRRGENRSSRRKTSRSRVENQQTQPTYDAGSGNRTRDTLVEGERSHHYTNPAPHVYTRPVKRRKICSRDVDLDEVKEPDLKLPQIWVVAQGSFLLVLPLFEDRTQHELRNEQKWGKQSKVEHVVRFPQ